MSHHFVYLYLYFLVEEVEEDLDDSNFEPDLTPITEHQGTK